MGELSNDAFIPVCLLSEEGEAPAYERQQVFRIEALCQRTVSHDLRTQHGDLLALAFHSTAHRQDLVGKVAGGSDLQGGCTQIGGVNGRRSAEGALCPGQGAFRRAGCAFLHGCHEAIPVAAESLDTVLPHPVIGHSLADHAQAPRQRRLGDELVGPAGRQEFVFRHRTMALGQEMYEDQKCLGLEGTYNARPAQFPAIDVEGALAKHKDHGTTSS